MAKPVENMVLRTVYLPKGLDNVLRDLAHRAALSKGEFMRILVQEALERRNAEGRLTDPTALAQPAGDSVRVPSQPTASTSEPAAGPEPVTLAKSRAAVPAGGLIR